MMKITLRVIGLLLFFLTIGNAPVSAVQETRQVTSEILPIPPYNEWACSRGDDKSRGVSSRMCRVIYDHPAVIPDAYDTIFEYAKIEATDPALLIWIRVAIDAESLRTLLYRRAHGEWVLIGDETFVRKAATIGKNIPFFTPNSQFGLQFQGLMCQLYEPDCKVYIPAFQFPR